MGFQTKTTFKPKRSFQSGNLSMNEFILRKSRKQAKRLSIRSRQKMKITKKAQT
jgi:hypothetical protein